MIWVPMKTILHVDRKLQYIEVFLSYSYWHYTRHPWQRPEACPPWRQKPHMLHLPNNGCALGKRVNHFQVTVVINSVSVQVFWWFNGVIWTTCSSCQKQDIHTVYLYPTIRYPRILTCHVHSRRWKLLATGAYKRMILWQQWQPEVLGSFHPIYLV